MSVITSYRFVSFGQALAASRGRRGWLQADLAKRLGVRQQTVSRWEKGASRPERAMVKGLGALLSDHSPEEWMSLAGHIRDSGGGPRRQAPNVIAPPLLAELPLSALPDERFEDFCRDVVAAQHPDATVHRFGGPGDRQYGIDIEAVFPDQARFVYQCKRYKRFGPEKVKTAVRALKTKADRAYVLLSRPATAAARKAIKPYRKWVLCDSADISRVVRQELPRDQACRLLDTYFPGFRQTFLGITDPNPFLSPDHYFAPFLKRTIFSHAWSLVGRAEALQQVTDILGRDSRSVVILSGSGGIGKSRVLRGLCEQFRLAQPHVAVRIVDSSANVTPKDFELLRGQETLLVVDDAHDRSDLNIICGVVGRTPDPIRLLLATRPYALSVVKAELSRAGLFLADDATTALKHLRRDHVEQLAREILTTLNGPIAAAVDIARVTADSPLATVVGSYLVATKRIHPSVLSNEENFRNELYRSFEDAITGNLGNLGNSGTVHDVLGLLALIQPIDPEAPDFREVATQIVSQPIDKVLRVLAGLHESGVLVNRGRRLRIVPDLLGEYILEDRCVVGPLRSSSGFAERVAASVGRDLLRHLIVNFSRLDWRLSQAADAADHIAGPLWESLMRSYACSSAARADIARAISEAAHYLPARALQFADLVTRQAGDEVEEIPKLLRRVAYNYEFINEACKRLWALGRADPRTLNQHPEHPVRILCELAAVEPDKPMAYCESVADFAIRELRDPVNHDYAYSLFDVLEAALKTEGHTTQSRGHAIAFTGFAVRFEAAKALRGKVIATLLDVVREGRSRAAVRAARALHEALRYPIGQFGHHPEAADRDAWTPEFLDTLEKVKSILATGDLDPIAVVGLQRAISWHSQYAQGPTHAAAVQANDAISKTLVYRLTLNLLDGWGHLRKRFDDYDSERKEVEAEMRVTARDLVATHPAPNEVRAVLEERFMAIRNLCGNDEGSSHIFMAVLAEECHDLCHAIWAVAITEGPTYPLTPMLDCLLGKCIERDPSTAIQIARKALATGREELSRAVAFAYGWHCGRGQPPTDDELDLIAALCIHEDPVTVTGVIRALERIAAKDKGRALDMFLSVDFGKDNRLAHEAFMVFLHEDNLRVGSLDAGICGKVLAKLLPLPEIDDYWITQFLGKASGKFPNEVLDFLLNRIDGERSLKGERLHGYDAIPWNWAEEAKLAYRDRPDFTTYVARVVRWLKGKDDWTSHMHAAVLFASMCRDYDDVTISALAPFLFSSDPNQVKAAGALLKKAPPGFVFAQPVFVASLLEHAGSLGQDTLEVVQGELSSSTISGTKQGTPGQPFPEDVHMRDRASEQLAALPKGSPAWKFFAELRRHAEAEIKHSQRDRPELEEFEEE